MPRDGALTFGDLDGKLDVLRVACRECDRRGRYPVAKLIERHGRDAKLVDWNRRLCKAGLMDLCGAHFPVQLNLYGSTGS